MENQNELRQLTDDESMHIADEKGRVFQVPKEHALAIVKTVPGFRYSFEHTGGKFVNDGAARSVVARPPRRHVGTKE